MIKLSVSGGLAEERGASQQIPSSQQYPSRRFVIRWISIFWQWSAICVWTRVAKFRGRLFKVWFAERAGTFCCPNFSVSMFCYVT